MWSISQLPMLAGKDEEGVEDTKVNNPETISDCYSCWTLPVGFFSPGSETCFPKQDFL